MLMKSQAQVTARTGSKSFECKSHRLAQLKPSRFNAPVLQIISHDNMTAVRQSGYSLATPAWGSNSQNIGLTQPVVVESQ